MLVKSETWRFWRACIPRFPRERSGIGSVLRIEFIANGLHPAPFEAGDPDRPPILRSADQRREHQLQDCLLAPCIGNDLHAPALLNVHPLKQVGGADHLAMLAGTRRCAMQASKSSIFFVRGSAAWMRLAKVDLDGSIMGGGSLVRAARPVVTTGSGRGGVSSRKPREGRDAMTRNSLELRDIPPAHAMETLTGRASTMWSDVK